MHARLCVRMYADTCVCYYARAHTHTHTLSLTHTHMGAQVNYKNWVASAGIPALEYNIGDSIVRSLCVCVCVCVCIPMA